MGEGWPIMLMSYIDRAFPDLDEKAREQLALNQHLSQLDNLCLKQQKRPDKLVDAGSQNEF